jgi:hypothetical protein
VSARAYFAVVVCVYLIIMVFWVDFWGASYYYYYYYYCCYYYYLGRAARLL